MNERIEIETSALNSDRSNMEDELRQIKEELNQLWEETDSLSGVWKGPAAIAYEGRVAQDMEEAVSLCGEIAEFIKCMDYASAEYNACERLVKGITDRIRV